MLTNRPQLKLLVESFRDWGRDCWCEPGEDNTCGKRFDWQLGDLPRGYDHKYIYSHIGYNLKVTDMQAAVGVAQLDKLPALRRARGSATGSSSTTGSQPLEDVLLLPRATRAQRAELVRLPDHRARGGAVRPQRARAAPRGAQDRDAAAVRRQPDAPAGV